MGSLDLSVTGLSRLFLVLRSEVPLREVTVACAEGRASGVRFEVSRDAETASSAAAPNVQSNLVPHALRQRLGDLIEQLTHQETAP